MNALITLSALIIADDLITSIHNVPRRALGDLHRVGQKRRPDILQYEDRRQQLFELDRVHRWADIQAAYTWTSYAHS